MNSKFYRSILLIIVILLSVLSNTVYSQTDSLRSNIQRLLNTTDATIGIAVLHLETRDTLSINGNHHFPMQSVYKFPLAMAMLDQIDKGKFSLDRKIHLTKRDLLPNTWSPLRDKYPNGDVTVTLNELLTYTVSQGDNNGCDITFRLLKRPASVNKYVHSLGVKDINIVATEEEMAKNWEVQFTNWSTPKAILQLLDIFYQRKSLSKPSSDFLWKAMVETATGQKRIKGLLPTGTIVAHRTGLSGTNDSGVTAATNDVGIVTLPNENHFAIVAFVSNSTANMEARENLIARIAKLVYDSYFVKD